MDVSVAEKDLQLRLSLSDADFLALLRAKSETDRFTYSNQDPELPSWAESKKRGVVACFSTNNGALTISGLINERLPIHFTLSPGSKSYRNLIKFLLGEIKNIAKDSADDGSVELNQKSSAHFGQNGKVDCAIERIKQNLKLRLSDCLPLTQTNGSNSSDTGQVSDAELASETVQFFRGDFKRSARRGGQLSKNQSLVIRSVPSERSFSLSGGSDQVRPQLISGFVNLEIEEILPEISPPEVYSASSALLTEQLASAVRSSLEISNPPKVVVTEGVAELTAEFRLDPELLPQVELLVHWGLIAKRPESSTNYWFDQEVSIEDLTLISPGNWQLSKTLKPKAKGQYGATVCISLANSGTAPAERVWFSEYGISDLRFRIENNHNYEDVSQLCQQMVDDIALKGRVFRGLSSFDQFVRTFGDTSRATTSRGIGELLAEVTIGDDGLRALVSEYYRRAIQCYEQQNCDYPRKKLRRIITLLQNIGVGEVVLIAPEGPHAIAGGMAQVVVGLSKSLARTGVSCSIISLLYEQGQGNKHCSAEELLSNGIQLMGKVVPVSRIGQIEVPFGPTYLAGTKEISRFAINTIAEVYLAESENVRLYLLRHNRLADKLYGGKTSEDQLRRAIFVSRGALEIIRDKTFGLNAHILLTNDWPTALVPFFLRTDKRYCEHSRLKDLQTCHIIHNGGRAYQGRFYVNQYGEDLWPMLNVEGKHFLGLSDPEDRSMFNLSASAICHSSEALIAVSQPYARQLLENSGGEGLESLYRQASAGLFGVSNGVDLSALRHTFWHLGENARAELGLPALVKGRLTSQRLVRRLPEYKSATKLLVQRKYGLTEDNSALLVSLVGRIAEQKGVSLLTSSSAAQINSVMHSVLESNSQLQILVCGPIAAEDTVAEAFRAEIESLRLVYPGRIVGAFQFVAHEQALEITLGSDLFLMPSRYEPGGITQLEALACGTPIVAHNVGGLSATLVDFCQLKEEGNSFLFNSFSSASCLAALNRAISVFTNRQLRSSIIEQAAMAENDWGHRTPKYIAIFQSLAGLLNGQASYSHLAGRRELLKSLRAEFSRGDFSRTELPQA